MNQTQINLNANKFYLIQILKSDSSNSFWTFTRWGRVGEKGQPHSVPFPRLTHYLTSS